MGLYGSVLVLTLFYILSLRFIIFFFIFSMVISFSLYFTGLYSQFNISNIVSSGTITILIFVFLLKSTNSLRNIDKTWLFILLALLCWTTAEILYGYYSGFLEVDAYPSLADIFYVTGYIFFILFLVWVNNTYKIELAFIISSLVTFSLFMFYILYISVFVFEVYNFSGSIYDLVLLFTYPIVDLFIVIGSVIYYLKGRTFSINKENTNWIFISLFGFFFFIADLTFGYNDLFEKINNEYVFDLYFNIGYLLLGVAILIRINFIQVQTKNKLL